MQSNFSSLCKGVLVPKEMTDKDSIHRFMEAVSQFERIINDSGFIRRQGTLFNWPVFVNITIFAFAMLSMHFLCAPGPLLMSFSGYVPTSQLGYSS